MEGESKRLRDSMRLSIPAIWKPATLILPMLLLLACGGPFQPMQTVAERPQTSKGSKDGGSTRRAT